MARLALILLALFGLSAPALADDISAAGRSVVRVVVIAFEDGEMVDFSHGSGFAVGRNRIVTNAHVVAIAREHPDSVAIGVVPSEGDQSFRAKLVAIDPSRDLALIEMVEGSVPQIPLYMGPLADGADVVALGYPGNVDLATAQSAEDFITPAAPTRSMGNYSNERRIAGINALLHTANVARGNSGGPLLDPCGRVIGVNSFITRGEDGDAPFGFAVSNRELAIFLRGAGQKFSIIGSDCVSMSDRLRDERDRGDREETERLRNDREAAQKAEQAALASAIAANQDRRENRVGIALLLGVLGVILVGGGGLMLAKDRKRPALILGASGLLLIAAGAVTFFTRPSRADLEIVPITKARLEAPKQVRLAGNKLCRIIEERSRVTVSSVEDVRMSWTDQGCVNGRTQYARNGDAWTRMLVPSEEATISVTEFRPAKAEYVVTRYLMGAADMKKARELRSQVELKSCSQDSEGIALLADRQAMIRSSLPMVPNERLVYRCTEE